MSQHNNTELADNSIAIPIGIGDRVSLLEDIDVDEEGGFTAGTLFEDTVVTYNPKTALLEFEDSDVGKAEFESLVEEADGYQII